MKPPGLTFSPIIAHNIDSEGKVSAIKAGILGRQYRSYQGFLPFLII